MSNKISELTIVGAGLSARALVEALRSEGSSLPVTVIDKDDFYWPRRGLIRSPADHLSAVNLQDWAVKFDCRFIRGKVERVNPSRKKIYLRKGQQAKDSAGPGRDGAVLVYKNLIVSTGLRSKKIALKGEQKEGFFYLSDLNPKQLKEHLRLNNESVVQSSFWPGIRLSFALRRLGQEVRLLPSFAESRGFQSVDECAIVSASEGSALRSEVKEPCTLACGAPLADCDFPHDLKQRLLSACEQAGINVNFPGAVEEVVGEGLVKAVKINPLKVFSAQSVFIDSGLTPRLDFFEEDVTIQDIFFTNFEGLMVLGDVSDKEIARRGISMNNHENCLTLASALVKFFSFGRIDLPLLKRKEESGMAAFFDEIEVSAGEKPPILKE